ncbi:MAG: response regulator [Planctomycetaceae bacterium]|jgi:signal transduction histidine kinase/DNA-binding response OmpR family regulator|nr:response regulator [Planctomycetaceae bacterium]MDC0273681.1 response regulator [Planctomycetaceae bacterium]MDG2388196.1 response regulator [Planctomycetaceae bacterium]
MPTRKTYWGISLKLALYLGLPLLVTVVVWLQVFVPASQDIMFNHEMTDLSDENAVRGVELEGQSKDFLNDFNLLARKLEEGDDDTFKSMSSKLESKYVLIEVLETNLSDDQTTPLELKTTLKQGTAQAYKNNLSYQKFIDSLQAEVKAHPNSEHVLTAFRKARLKIDPAKKPDSELPYEVENHVFWIGSQIISPNEDGDTGRVLVMALGFDEKLARLIASPRHMAILADQDGRVILNPFSSQQVANEAGEFVKMLSEMPEPFNEGPLLADTSKFLESPDWNAVGLGEVSIDTLKLPEVASEGLSLKPGQSYYYWESKDVGLEPAELEVASIAVRRETAKLSRQEWDASEEPLIRGGGLSPTVATIRIMSSDPEEIPKLQKRLIDAVKEEFVNHTDMSEDAKAVALSKLKRLARQVPDPFRCTTNRYSGVQIPLTVSPTSDLSGFLLLRGVFEEEVRAALDAELNQEKMMFIGMTFLTFGIVFFMGRRIGKILERMSVSAESISNLTFDQEADVETWEKQANAVSSRLPTDRQDELGVLSRSFQRMLVDILNAQVELRKLNAELEERVNKRTLQLQAANNELGVANKELKRGRDEAEQLSRSKDEFLASVSHELRNPLNWLHGSVQFLEMTELDEQQQHDVQTVRRATEELGALIEDILDYQKIVMNGMPIEVCEVDLETLLREVWDSLRLMAEKHDSELDFHWTEPTGMIQTDPRRFKQVVKNLAGNSCKFRDPEGKRPNQVQVNVERHEDHLKVIVSDTGRGMKSEVQGKLFVKFQKLSSQEGNKSGTGLGLVITKSLVELMDGTIDFESEYGVGTTFTIELPLTYETHMVDGKLVSEGNSSERTPSADAVRRISSATSKQPHKLSKVMVIDDDPKMQEMMKRYLTDHGFEVIIAVDGIQALGLVKKEEPDLITLDVKLPELDGWAVLAALKTDVETADVPVIMTTTLDDREKGMALGADEYLVKPVDWTHLERVIRQFSQQVDSPTVLVIEDDEQNRVLLKRQLESCGWTVEEAEDGRQALEHLADNIPQLILLDLMMPVMDGFEFLAERQKSAELLSVPVIVVTAKELTPNEIQQLRGSVIRVLQKGTYSQPELLEEIRQELERRQRGNHGDDSTSSAKQDSDQTP